MVRQLIDLGADPNEPCCSFWSKDPSQGDTGKKLGEVICLKVPSEEVASEGAI